MAIFGYFGHFYQFDHNGLTKYGHEYVPYWFLCKKLFKRGLPVKTELKNMHRIKSYGQNKIGCEILAISFVFWPIFRTKMALPEAALPMGSQSSSLYFWNQWNQENGGSLHANWKSNFYFFCPPLIDTSHHQQLLVCILEKICGNVWVVQILIREQDRLFSRWEQAEQE